jgi:hypothetical protein
MTGLDYVLLMTGFFTLIVRIECQLFELLIATKINPSPDKAY